MTEGAADAKRWVQRGGRLVTLARAAAAGGPRPLTGSGAPTLRMVLAAPEGAYVVEARCEGTGGEHAETPPRAGRLPSLHDHFAVDVDLCAEERWLCCADLLHGSVPRPREHAMRWVADVLAARIGCRLAALPLDDGGWAVAERRGSREPVRRCLAPAPSWCGGPPTAAEHALLPSCLYGWAAAGRPLRRLASMVVLTRGACAA